MTTKTLASAGQSKYTAGYMLGSDGNLTNSGVTLINKGTVGVSASQWGVEIYGSGNTVVNYGIIEAAGAGGPPAAGIAFATGNDDVAINKPGATLVSGTDAGFYAGSDSAGRATNVTLINGGVIKGTGAQYEAVVILDSGIVTNLSTGTIIQGIAFYSGLANGATATSNVSVVNSGTILGGPTYGAIYMLNGGNVTNLAGTISGNADGKYGIFINNKNGLNTASTITNAGTIEGGSSGASIILSAVAGNRVIDQSGGVFIGTVNGGSNATMELASTASAGVLTATGGQFTNFSTLSIDSGAQWTIKGDSGLNTEFATIGGFTVGDTISLTGLSSTPTTFASSTAVNAGTTTTSVIIKAGSTALETLTLLGSIASSRFSFVPGTTSTLTETAPAPVVTSGGTVTFNGGGAAVTADPGLTVTDAGSATLASATVAIGGFISGDTLTVGTPGGLTSSFSSGTLTLTGSASLATFQTALDSVDYSFTAEGDPTGGGSHTSRTIDWTVNDGSLVSNTGTSTLDVVHTAPTVTAGATATFTGGGGAVVLDSGIAVSDVDSGGVLSSATITVTGAITGDTLNFININSTTEGNISVASDSNGVLKLTSSGETATVAQWQTALESVTYSFSPSNGDPTNGGGDTSRTIDWSVNDGVRNSGTVTSTLDVVHVAPAVTASGTVSYSPLGTAAVLDSTLTASDPDSGGNLTGATIKISTGFTTGDMLNFSTQNGITESSFNNGTLSLIGTASIANYETALRSITYSSSLADPTVGGTDDSRTITWMTTDGAASSAPATSSLAVLCFCEGTWIATPDGEVAVEKLAVGDKVRTASGATREIRWVGLGKVLATRGRRNAATPVIVQKGAIADNVPHHDLRVTKGHAFFLDDVLIPVEFLVNHRSIRWDDRAQEVSLYHIELETHDILLANGAPAESYRDDGNRWLFQNGNAGWHLPPQPPCAPVLTGGPIVDAAWRRLLERDGPRRGSPLTDDPDLHLLVAGKRIDAVERSNGVYAFQLRVPPRNVRICSRAAAPQEIGVARDARLLGVPVRRILLAQARAKRSIAAESASLVDGYHLFEPENDIRWTDGDAVVPAALFASISGPSMLIVQLGGTTQYIDDGEASKAA